jgi:hypothetical protein
MLIYANPRVLWLLSRCRVHSLLCVIDYQLARRWLIWSGLDADFAAARKRVERRFAELDAEALRLSPPAKPAPLIGGGNVPLRIARWRFRYRPRAGTRAGF